MDMNSLESITPYFFTIAVVVVGAICLWHEMSSCRSRVSEGIQTYSYQDYNGPSMWTKTFPAADGCNQSPVNLQDTLYIDVPSETAAMLTFSNEFCEVPLEMKIFNNGTNVVLYACWDQNKKPCLVGGPLQEDYQFVNLRFRWGLNDCEGSEHMVNSSRFAMELQAAFVKSSCYTEDIIAAAGCNALLFLSYVFKVTHRDNPYLEPIITSLKYIRSPFGCICIEPIILSLLMPDFNRNYFYYEGSLTFPPCTEGVQWIVKPEPMMISSKQVNQFRKLCGCWGPILTNTRPVQNINRRQVYYYN